MTSIFESVLFDVFKENKSTSRNVYKKITDIAEFHWNLKTIDVIPNLVTILDFSSKKSINFKIFFRSKLYIGKFSVFHRDHSTFIIASQAKNSKIARFLPLYTFWQ